MNFRPSFTRPLKAVAPVRIRSGLQHENGPLTCGNAGQGAVAAGAIARLRGSYVGRAASKVAAVGSLVPLLAVAGILAGIGLTTPADFDDLVGECTPQMRALEGSVCWKAPAPVTDVDAALREAGEIARLTEGMECWDASQGRLPSHVVVRSEAGVALLPFDDATWQAAQRGEFVTLQGCA